MVNLNKEVQYIKTVGPSRAELLNKIGIYTLKDLITYFPREYEDRGKIKKICECIDGETALIEAVVVTRIVEIKMRSRTMYKLQLRDETGTCTALWFNQSYLKNIFKVGEKYKFYGKISSQYGRVEIASPIFERASQSNNTGKIIPIYPLTKNLTQNVLRKIIELGLSEVEDELEETLPEYLLEKYKLMELNQTIKKIHFPEKLEEFEKARKRLAFEELLIMQLALLELKNSYLNEKNGIAFDKKVQISELINELPFKLTKAQLRVLEEIELNMESEKEMNRLLQGDVGSGKTVISILSAYKAVKSGYQVAIMAPTAILATQHLESFTQLLEPKGIRCELLISSTTKKQKELLRERLKNGEIDILIGTHAILEENVEFKKLGLVVTDEQHRFGVKQRTKITEKGQNPDVLVMSATPIPRTLALILYGDLDISIIDELPPNRKKIETYAVRKNMEERVNNFVRQQIGEGRQCYIVCPLVEEDEESDLKAVTSLAEKYQKEVVSEYKVEYLHGKMKAKEKEQIMNQFKEGNIDILISTTVIEVGVNVPNASLMIVENAERFGLAQLHQLRGRVGRGEYKSYCVLKYEGKGENTRERMKVMCETNDGFIISEKDLELRGSGDFFGTAQHGLPELKIANLFEDMPLLKEVQKIAIEILEEDKKLEQDKNKKLKKAVKEKFKARIEI